MKVLFILKYRDNKFDCDDYSTGTNDPTTKKPLSSGLLNSATFVHDMLNTSGEGIESKLVSVIDNNAIDREVTLYKPDVVVIEAMWVVSEKFEILHKLHPNVTWIVRNHSGTIFLACEGSITDFALRYMDYPNVVFSCNEIRTHHEYRDLIKVYKPDWSEEYLDTRSVFLPNYYPTEFHKRHPLPKSDIINIASFGAVRPLKNTLIQVISAIQFAEKHGKILHFHINGTRVEGNGSPVLHNIRGLFKNITKHKLVEHNWLSHEDFIKLNREMDLCMQCSLTESANIVSMDAVMNDVPVCVSPEIFWVSDLFKADPTSSKDIVKAMETALFFDHSLHFVHPNVAGLRKYVERSKEIWLSYLLNL